MWALTIFLSEGCIYYCLENASWSWLVWPKSSCCGNFRM